MQREALIRSWGKSIVLLVLSGCCMAFQGCAFPVHVSPAPAPTVTEKIDLDVGLFINEAQTRQIHSQSGFCLLGAAHTWNIETGPALRLGAERAFKRVFAGVEVLESPGEFAAKPLTLLITPEIHSFSVSQDLRAELDLHCQLVDRTGKTVYQNTIPSRSGSQAATGCLLGVAGGKMALSKASEEAFNTAFASLADDVLGKVDFSPYLKE